MSRQTMELPIDDIIVDNDFNCRDQLVPSDVMQLAYQIKQMRGLIQPVVVRKEPDGSLHLVAGFRRWHACKKLKMETITAIVRDDLTQLDAAAINLAENIERKNLTPLEEARALNKLLAQGYDSQAIGAKLQRSPSWVETRLAILRLPIPVQNEVALGNINLKQVKHLAGLPENVQYATIRAIKERTQALESDKVRHLAEKHKKKISRTSRGSLRQPKIIAAVRVYLYELFGDSIEVAALSWAEGNIDFTSFERYIKEQCDIFDVEFKPYEEI